LPAVAAVRTATDSASCALVVSWSFMSLPMCCCAILYLQQLD
jgi:hypothetical protein